MTEGLTNREMAERLGVTEAAIATRLASIMAAMGASDRAQATALAMRGLGAALPEGRGSRRRRRASRRHEARLMPLVVRVDRHKCIGAGNCITLAPTAFDWLQGRLRQGRRHRSRQRRRRLLYEAAFACPTAAIVIEQVTELLPWQLRGKAEPKRRVLKTFMFTDVVGSTNLVEVMGDEAWDTLLRWHDTTLREVFTAHQGSEISTTGDGFFVGFDSPEQAVAAAMAIQRRLAEHRKRRLRAAGPDRAPRRRRQQVGDNFRGRGVHEASRIAGPGEGRRDRRQHLDGRRQPIRPRRLGASC